MNIRKQHLLFISQIIVSIGLLLFIFRKIDLSFFAQLVREPDFYLLVVAFILYLMALFVSSYKWSLLANNIFSLKLRFRYFVFYNLVGGFYSIFVPGGSMIGEGVKAWRLSRRADARGRLFLSVAIDRIVGFVSIGLLIFFIFIFDPIFRKDVISVIGLFASLAFLSLGLIFLFVPRLFNLILGMLSSFLKKTLFYKYTLPLKEYMKDYHAQPGLVVASILIAGFSHLLVAGTIFKIAESLMIPVSFSLILWSYLISLVITFIPISYAGLGIREGIFVYFFLLAGIPKEQTLSISVLYFGVLVLLAIMGGVIEFKELWFSGNRKNVV